MTAQFQAEGQILSHGHVRIQRVTLEHHRDVAILGGHVVDRASVDGERAVADRLQPRDHPQQRGLAAAGRPDQHQQFAVGHLETGAGHGNVPVRVNLAKPIERHCRHVPSSSGAASPAALSGIDDAGKTRGVTDRKP
jgi:hypothetical protein